MRGSMLATAHPPATRRPHGGAPVAGVLDFSANLNPLGPPDSLAAALSPEHVLRYPEPGSATLAAALAERHAVEPEQVLVTNGACEAIELVMVSLAPRRVVVLAPAFTEYEDAARAWGHEVVTIIAREKDEFRWRLDEQRLRADDLLVLGNPASPTGVLTELPDVDCPIVVDETYMDFVSAEASDSSPALFQAPKGPKVLSQGRKAPDSRPAEMSASPERATVTAAPPGLNVSADTQIQGLTPLATDSPPLRDSERAATDCGHATTAIRRPRTLVIRSFTKLFACPGLRLGYVVGDVTRLRTRQPAWSVSRLAQTAGLAMLRETDYQRFTREYVAARRAELFEQLDSLPAIKVFPSAANFLLLRIPQAGDVSRRLLERGIAVRLCDSFTGLERDCFIRVAVRKRSENQRLVEALAEVLDASR